MSAFDEDMALSWFLRHYFRGRTRSLDEVDQMCMEAPDYDAVLEGIDPERVRGRLKVLVEQGDLVPDGDGYTAWTPATSEAG